MSAKRKLSRLTARSGSRVVPSAKRPNPPLAQPTASRRAFPKCAICEVMIMDDIGWITAAQIREQLNVFGSEADVAFRINSAGGYVTEGMAMYAAIRKHKGRTTGIVEGIAASMASVILQACDVRLVASGSYVMIHNPSSRAEGESEEMRKEADLLDKIKSDLVDIYQSRSGLDREKIETMMNETTYLTAEEAVEMGFADYVDDLEATAAQQLKAVAKLDTSKMPESLRALLNKGASMTEEEMKARIAALEEENAKLKAKSEEEEKSEDEEETDENESEDDDEDDDKKEAKAVLAAARRITGKKSLAEVEGSLIALSHNAKVQTNGSRATAVAALVKAGKLAPADKAWALKCSDKAFAAYSKAVAKSSVIGSSAGQLPATPPGVAPVVPGAPGELTTEEKRVAKAMGKTKEQMIAGRTANPFTTKETL